MRIIDRLWLFAALCSFGSILRSDGRSRRRATKPSDELSRTTTVYAQDNCWRFFIPVAIYFGYRAARIMQK